MLIFIMYEDDNKEIGLSPQFGFLLDHITHGLPLWKKSPWVFLGVSSLQHP